MHEYGLTQRLATANNRYQGDYKRVLCVCSAGLLRSPTAAVVLANEPFNFNTRSAGSNPAYALIMVDEVLIKWADEILCMEQEHYNRLENSGLVDPLKTYHILGIPDNYPYRQPELIEKIKEKYCLLTKSDI